MIALHQKNIIHRYLNVDNILRKDDTIKIADLGISRIIDPNDFAHTFTGKNNHLLETTLNE